MTRQIRPATTLDNLKKEAKRWLKALRAGDEQALARLKRALPMAPSEPGLRDVQYALAREHGLAGWTALIAQLGNRAGVARQDVDVIQPEELRSERPYGSWSSRGCDVWDAIRAARTGDARSLRRLLERDPNLSRYGEPLRFAVREGHAEAVQLLLAAGAEPDAAGPDGESLTTVARDRGHEAVARILEDAIGRSARIAPAGATAADPPIHLAADGNDAAALGALLDAEPRLLELGDRKGGTPLHRAVLASARDAIGVLLDRGADIRARHGAGRGDDAGYAAADFEPIDLALFWHGRGDLETARLLLARGAATDLTVAAALGDLGRVTRLLAEDPGRIREQRPCGKRPLPAAVELGHDAIAALLLERGADPCWPEGAEAPRGSALHTAARAGNRAMVELLLDRGADPSANVDSAGNATSAAKTRELRALLMARGGTLDCYDLVWLDEDDEVVRRVTADPSEANAGCGGVFTAAATLGKRDLVVRLLNAGARVPPVLTACRSYLLENAEILRLLLAEGGMDPNLPDWQRATLLHATCGRDGRGRPLETRVECAAILLDAGADISARDEEYRSTPLAWAARNGLPDLVELLLSRGAPTRLDDDEPWATPLAWAMRRGHERIVEVLRAAGASA
jgi:ankyrin repeat protein